LALAEGETVSPANAGEAVGLAVRDDLGDDVADLAGDAGFVVRADDCDLAGAEIVGPLDGCPAAL
jgi:hypothetical protein